MLRFFKRLFRSESKIIKIQNSGIEGIRAIEDFNDMSQSEQSSAMRTWFRLVEAEVKKELDPKFDSNLEGFVVSCETNDQLYEIVVDIMVYTPTDRTTLCSGKYKFKETQIQGLQPA